MDWFSKIVRFISEIVAPHEIDTARIEAMTSGEFAARATPLKIGREIPHTIIPFEYGSPIVRKSIWEIKFRGNKKIATLVASVLYDALLEELADMHIFHGKDVPILAVVPMTAQARRERGWNQCEIIADALLKIDAGPPAQAGKNFTYQKDTLVKIRETKDSVGLSKKERAENLAGCFAVKNPNMVRGKTVIVLDDVVTTGATLAESRRALKSAGAKKIIGLALAH